MRDWKKRWIVAGVLLFVAFCIFVYRLSVYEDEAALISDARFVETEQQLQEALKHDGYIYAKGKIEGDLDSRLITLIDGELSVDSTTGRQGYKDAFMGQYLTLQVMLGHYEYDKDVYKQSARYVHYFVERERKELVSKAVTVLGMTFPVTKPEKLVERAGVYQNQVGDGAIVKDADGRMVPSIETPENVPTYEGYKLTAIPSGIDAVLKLQVKNGSAETDSLEIISTSDFEQSKELADTGKFDYATEIMAYMILWILMTLVAWLIMKMLGM